MLTLSPGSAYLQGAAARTRAQESRIASPSGIFAFFIETHFAADPLVEVMRTSTMRFASYLGRKSGQDREAPVRIGGRAPHR